MKPSENTSKKKKTFSISKMDSKVWIESSQVCTKIVDLDFNLQYMSSAGIAALCIDDVDTYYNKPYPLQFYPGEYRDIWKECYEEVKSTQKVVSKDILAISLKGEELWFDSTFIPILDENRCLEYIIVTSVYISHRTDKLQQVNERLELALLGNNDGVWDWNLLDNSVYFSPRWKEMLGYQDNEIINEFSQWESRAHPDDVPRVLEDIQGHINGNSEYVDCVHRLKHKEGHWVWIHSRAKGVFDKDGNAVRLAGTHTDITEHKNMELELLKKKTEFQAIYEGNKDAIAILDEASNFLQVNNAYIEMTGMSEE